MGEQRMRMVEETTVVTDQEISVIKRDGRSVKFDSSKIFETLQKAGDEIVPPASENRIAEICDRVVREIFTRFTDNVKIYEIQSIVEHLLMELGETKWAEV